MTKTIIFSDGQDRPVGSQIQHCPHHSCEVSGTRLLEPARTLARMLLQSYGGWKSFSISPAVAHPGLQPLNLSKGNSAQFCGESFHPLPSWLSSTCRNPRMRPPFTLASLHPCYSKCGPQTCSSSIPWKLARCRLQASWMVFALQQDPRGFICRLQSEKPCWILVFRDTCSLRQSPARLWHFWHLNDTILW